MLLTHRTSGRLLAGNSHPALARSLANELSMSPFTPKVARFADGETRIDLADDVRGCQCVRRAAYMHAGESLALLADAAYAAGAFQVTSRRGQTISASYDQPYAILLI